METVNVSGLKNNPSEALRKSHHDVVVVMNRDRPDALMVGLDSSDMLQMKGVRAALATALFRDGHLSLARSARVAEMPVAAFVAHVSRLGIAVVRLDAREAARDMDTLDEWLASS
jgi:predicted HTH domain antitoxin